MASITRAFPCSLRNIRSLKPRLIAHSSRLLSNKVTSSDNDDFDKPIQYSTSKAATWKAEQSFSGLEREDVTPWYQPLVISGSLAVFLIYFGVFREENDIDEELSMSLYDRIDGLEEVQVRNAISYYEEFDKTYDTTPLKKRLAELEAIKLETAK